MVRSNFAGFIIRPSRLILSINPFLLHRKSARQLRNAVSPIVGCPIGGSMSGASRCA